MMTIAETLMDYSSPLKLKYLGCSRASAHARGFYQVPNAQNAELKALLVKVRPAFVAHMEHAKMIQSSLGK
jgi:hypothetical protein